LFLELVRSGNLAMLLTRFAEKLFSWNCFHHGSHPWRLGRGEGWRRGRGLNQIDL
jgi:hypothetical protein